MSRDTHYLEQELYRLLGEDPSIFDFLQKGSLDGIWYWDLEKPENEWMSPQFWTTLGYDPREKEHLVSEWQNLIDPEDLEVALDNFRRHCEDPNHPYDQVVRYRHKNGSTVWVRCRGIAIRDEEGKSVRMLGAHNELTRQKQAELDLEKMAGALQQAQKVANMGSWWYDPETRMSTWSEEMFHILGLKPQPIAPPYEVRRNIIHPEDREHFDAAVARAVNEGIGYDLELRIIRPDGNIRHVHSKCVAWKNNDGVVTQLVGTTQDITERKLYESEREITLKLLQALYKENDLRALIREVATLMKNWSGCQAVGIRLRQEEDYPYFEARGFPPEFVEAERRLCALNEEGEILRDSTGNPVLECMCGNVICGRFNPDLPFFTKMGSFWTNSTTDLLASTTEADRQARTRNRCHGEGYESVALIPLSIGDQRIGLLQFNDPQRDRFDEQRIALFERLASSLAIGLSQRKMALELRESEKKYRLLAENVSDIIWTMDMNMRFTYFSPSVERLQGFKPEEAIHQTVEQLLTPDSFKKAMKVFNEELDRHNKGERDPDKPVVFELELMGKNGSTIMAEAQTNFIHDKEGRPIGVIGVTRDITERLKTEKELRFKDAIVEQSSDSIICTDKEFHITYLNKAAQDLYGWSLDEIKGKTPEFLNAEPDAPDIQQKIYDTVSSGNAYEGISLNLRKDESTFYCQCKISPLLDQYGNIYGYLGSQRDISDLIKKEKELFESETRYRLTLETVNEGIILQAASGEILTWNKGAEDIFGISSKDAVGQTLEGYDWPTIHEDGSKYEGKDHPSMNTLRTGKPCRNDIMGVYRPSGEVRWISINTNALFPENGNTPYAVAISFSDITESKRIEESLRSSEARLARTSRMLTCVLEHTHMMAAYLDPQFNFIWVNRAYAETCRQDLSFFPGKNHFDLYPHEENQAIFQRVVDTGELFFVAAKPFEFPDQPECGVTYWDWSLIPVKNDNGNVTGLVFTLAEVTDRIRAEEALRDSEAKFSTLVDQVPAALFLHDMQGRIVGVNQATLDGYGHTREQLLQMKVEHIDPDFATREDSGAFLRKLEKQRKLSFEARHRRRDGSLFPVNVTLSRVLLGGKKHIIALAEDITDRKRTEETLRESERRHRSILQTAMDGLWLADVQGRLLEANETYRRMSGYSVRELMSMRISDLEAVETDDDVVAHMKETITQGGDRFETRHRRKDGTTYDVEVSVQYLPIEGGLIVAFLRDITEHKRAEEALLESEERFRASFMGNPKAAGICRQGDGVWVDINQAALDMFGYNREEVIGTSALSTNFWVDPGERQRIMTMLEQGEEVRNQEVQLVHKDGRTIIASVSVRALTFKGIKHFLVITEDVTERKLIEEERELNTARLEALLKLNEKHRSDANELAEFAIEESARLTRSNIGFINFLSDDEKEVTQTVYTQKTLEHCEVPEEIQAFAISGCGLWSEAYRQKRPIVVNDYTSEHPAKMGLPGGHLELRRFMSIPVFEGDSVVAIAALGNKEAEYNEGDVRQFRLFMEGLWQIMQRRKAESALKLSEEKFSKAFRSAPLLMSINSVEDGRFLDVNDGFVRATGYDRETVIGSTPVEIGLNTSEDRSLVLQVLNAEGRVQEQELELNAADGTKIVCLCSGEVIEFEGKKRLLFIGSDITERKRNLSSLWETSERFQKVFNSQLDAIFVLNAEIPARVIESNEAVTAIFGYEPDEVIGQTTEKMHVNKSYMEEFRKKLASAVESEGVLGKFEYSMKRKDGSIFPTEHTVLELRNDAGERTGWISVVRELTERKQMENRLLQAQRMEAIGTLAGGIAHDFNNILFPIVAMSEMLVEDLPMDSPENESAKEIFKAGRRGSDLVKQILTFSRKSEHKMIPIQVQRVLRETIKLTRSTIPSNLVIVDDIQNDCGLVKADPTQVHQIAMNLITNAYHAVESTNGTISIRVAEAVLGSDDLVDDTLKPGRYAMLTVSDTGCGIAPAIVGRIFEPYFTTKEQGKGTGLGLAVVYGIVKEHHGGINMYSEVGRGTTFNVFLPLIQESPETPSFQKVETYPTGNERILLVDDEKPIVQLEKKILERLGYQVTTLNSSKEALDAFRADPDAFDLVITDMTMPNMTGDRLAGKLLSTRANIPIILCTGFSEAMNEKKAAEIGIKALLIKPIVKSDMAKTVRNVLDEAEGLAQR